MKYLSIAILIIISFTSSGICSDYYLFYDNSPWMESSSWKTENNNNSKIHVSLTNHPIYEEIFGKDGTPSDYNYTGNSPKYTKDKRVDKFFKKGSQFIYISKNCKANLSVIGLSIQNGGNALITTLFLNVKNVIKGNFNYHESAIICPITNKYIPKKLIIPEYIKVSKKDRLKIILPLFDEKVKYYDERTRKSIMKKMSEISIKDTYGNKKHRNISEEFNFNRDTKIYAGKFPHNCKYLIVINVKLRKNAPIYYSSSFYMDKNFEKRYFVNKSLVSINKWEVNNFIDIDSDGIYDLIVDESYYEGSFRYLYMWNGHKYDIQLLDGYGF